MPLREARHILDLGTGTGALLPTIVSFAPGALIAGVDRSEGMLQLARERANVSLLLSDARTLPLRSNDFDVAVLAYMLFHVPEPQRCLRETLRVLRTGGVAGLVTWKIYPRMPGAAECDECLERFGAGPDARPPELSQHELMDTPEKVQALLRDAGFDAIRTWSVHLEHHFEREALIALQLGHGAQWRRLRTIPEPDRAACAAAIHERLATLSADDLLYRAEVIASVAAKS